MQVPNWIKALLSSRKFWVALVTAVVLAVALFQGSIEPDQFADGLLALALAVIAAITGEDMASKWNGNHPTQ